MNGLCDEYCKECFFSSQTPNTGQARICDYILITYMKRPCKAGTGCTVRVKKQNGGKYSLEEKQIIWCKGNFAPT